MQWSGRGNVGDSGKMREEFEASKENREEFEALETTREKLTSRGKKEQNEDH
jgi:hypothetical protein